jgi:hypothetical protein
MIYIYIYIESKVSIRSIFSSQLYKHRRDINKSSNISEVGKFGLQIVILVPRSDLFP